MDSSAVVAVLFDEPRTADVRRVLDRCERLYSSNLLEAEVRAAAKREGVPQAETAAALSHLGWVFPDRPLTLEIEQVLRGGHLRGADLWHLACALFVAEVPSRLPFVTLDAPQASVARTLGFPVPASA